MALVAYGNSDSSDYEDDNNEITSVSLINKTEDYSLQAIQKSLKDTIKPQIPEQNSERSIFNWLPQPSTIKSTTIEEDDEFLHKKETGANIVKPKTKITVPSLSDFKDVEEKPNFRPKIINGKTSGLLSMLPQPKHAALTTTMKSLIPNQLAQKPATAKKKTPLPTPLKKQKTEPKSLINYSDESDNEDDVQNDFFSINKPIELPEDVPLDIDLDRPKVQAAKQKLPQGIESYFKKDVVENQVEVQPDFDTSTESHIETHSDNGYEMPQSSNSGDMLLDEEAIQALCGSRGKRKREEIQILDINQQEVLADAREQLLKGLMDDTSQRMSSSKKGRDEPTNQQKRKHQITYLAHQAKAKEAELQNQWANNRMSKRQTQNKYGF